ncbi:MAG: hypothetical protein ACRC5R_05615 [Mycoplasmatales bacterium]
MKIVDNKENKFVRIDFTKSSIIQFNKEEYMDFLKINLDIYFNSKKVTNLSVLDEDGDLIKRDKICFIDFSKKVSYKEEIEISKNSKTLEYINKYMQVHDTEFTTFNEMLTLRGEMKTDSGIYNIIKNISFGLSNNVEILPKPFTFNTYAQLYCINGEMLDPNSIKLININCEILLNNEKQIIILINEYVLTKNLIMWINILSKRSNIIFIISNKFELTIEIKKLEIPIFQYIFDNESKVDEIDIGWKEYEMFLYSLRNNTKLTLKFQKKEIIEIFEEVNLQKKILFIRKLENDMIAKIP